MAATSGRRAPAAHARQRGRDIAYASRHSPGQAGWQVAVEHNLPISPATLSNGPCGRALGGAMGSGIVTSAVTGLVQGLNAVFGSDVANTRATRVC